MMNMQNMPIGQLARTGKSSGVILSSFRKPALSVAQGETLAQPEICESYNSDQLPPIAPSSGLAPPGAKPIGGKVDDNGDGWMD